MEHACNIGCIQTKKPYDLYRLQTVPVKTKHAISVYVDMNTCTGVGRMCH